MKVVPDEYLYHAHHWLILHGRYVCKARKPDCQRCLIADICKYRYEPKTPPPAPSCAVTPQSCISAILNYVCGRRVPMCNETRVPWPRSSIARRVPRIGTGCQAVHICLISRRRNIGSAY